VITEISFFIVIVRVAIVLWLERISNSKLLFVGLSSPLKRENLRPRLMSLRFAREIKSLEFYFLLFLAAFVLAWLAGLMGIVFGELSVSEHAKAEESLRLSYNFS
jgi:hypothetical protein